MNNNKDKKNALISAMLGSFMTPFLSSSINVALPTIEFHMDAVTMSWVSTIMLLTSAAFVVPIGKISDIWGRKKMYTTGMLVMTLSIILAALAIDPITLIMARGLQGFAAGMTFATGMAITTSLFEPHERGKAIGWVISIVYIGLSFGPFVGGIVTQHLGWRALFLINLPMSISGWYFAFKIKQEWKIAQDTKFDYLGTIIYIISIVMIMMGFSKLTTFWGAIIWGAGIAGIIAFAIYEHKIKNPILDISLFWRNTRFTFSNIASFINYATTFSVGFLLSLFLQISRNMSPAEAGTILIAQPIVMATLTPLSGKLSDKYDASVLSSIGMAISALGLLALSFLHLDTSITFVVSILLFLGLGFALFSSPNTVAIMGSVEKHELALASSISSTMRTLGQMMSMGLTMLVIAFFVGEKESLKNHPDGLINTIHFAFILFTILSVIGIFASLFRGKKK